MNNQESPVTCSPVYFEEKSDEPHELLKIIQTLDLILFKIKDLPEELQKPIILARNNSWKLFAAGREEVKNKRKEVILQQ